MGRSQDGRPATDPDPRLCGVDSSPFTAFYLRHVDDVLRFVVRRVADPHVAADLTVAGRRLLDADDIGHFEERIDAAEGARRVHMEMAALHAGERAVLELIAVDGLTVTEAAAAEQTQPTAPRAAARWRRPARIAVTAVAVSGLCAAIPATVTTTSCPLPDSSTNPRPRVPGRSR
ncbi:RNA polymerase sigma factor [Actinomadura fibrosa]|uniref:RNA polymerase sigma factor n=1 Tax=Actinomadura fibrosa TaxID=111802 RepID=A0ABW2XWD8_9ACTN|nr:hypothetical protein [Actinomadura fibrosa]